MLPFFNASLMDKKTQEQLKTKLLGEEQRLMKELSTILGKPQGENTSDSTTQPPFPQFGSKDDENAAEVATFSDALSLQRTIEESLTDVRRALSRMAKGEYGLCRYCGKPIDERRLLARPESSSCVACKEELKSRP